MTQTYRRTPVRFKSLESGGVALEYVIVSTFAAIAGAALIGIATHIFKERLQALEGKLDIDINSYDLNPFGE